MTHRPATAISAATAVALALPRGTAASSGVGLALMMPGILAPFLIIGCMGIGVVCLNRYYGSGGTHDQMKEERRRVAEAKAAGGDGPGGVSQVGTSEAEGGFVGTPRPTPVDNDPLCEVSPGTTVVLIELGPEGKRQAMS